MLKEDKTIRVCQEEPRDGMDSKEGTQISDPVLLSAQILQAQEPSRAPCPFCTEL